MPTERDVHKPERWSRTHCSHQKYEAPFRSTGQGWTDALRTIYPDQPIYTFFDYFRNAYGRNAGLQIDHLLFSPKWRYFHPQHRSDTIAGMGLDRIKDLSARERECLRLVSRTGSSDTIAATLNISRETVETLIKRARAKLGGVSRFVAAEALMEWEKRPQSLGTDETGTENATPTCDPELVLPPEEEHGRGEEVNEDDAGSAALPPSDPPIVAVARRNTLRPLSRIFLLIAGAALMTVAILGMMVIAKEAQLWLSPGVPTPTPPNK